MIVSPFTCFTALIAILSRAKRRKTPLESRWNLEIGGGPAVFPPSPRLTYQPACKPGSVRPAGASRKRDGHSSGTPVARRIKQPTRTTGPDGPGACAPTSFLFGLAPGGVCRAVFRRWKRGALLPHRFTLTAAKTLRSRGGLFSVALSLKSRPVKGSTPPDVIRHRSSMEPGLSSPAAFRHWRGAAVRPTDGDSNGVARPPRQGRRANSVKTAFSGRAAPAAFPASARSVSIVDASARPSTRAGRKWRWKAVTTSRVASS